LMPFSAWANRSRISSRLLVNVPMVRPAFESCERASAISRCCERLAAPSDINNNSVKASSDITPTWMHFLATALNDSPVSSRFSQIIPMPDRAPEVNTPYNNSKSRWSGSITQRNITHIAVVAVLLFQLAAGIWALIHTIRTANRDDDRKKRILRNWGGLP
jgi:hypothetical protein